MSIASARFELLRCNQIGLHPYSERLFARAHRSHEARMPVISQPELVLAAPTQTTGIDRPSVEVAGDYGGNISDYLAERGRLERENAAVRIDGPCASACTLLLGLRPENVCVGPHAALGFHRAIALSDDAARRADAAFLASYPTKVRAWLDQRGGLQQKLVWASPSQTRQLVRACN